MELPEHIKKEIEKFEFEPQIEEIGRVIEVKDGTAKISGLKNVGYSEIIKFEQSGAIFGLTLSLEEETVRAIIFGDDSKIKEGTLVKRTDKILSLPVGEELIGRVIDPLGNPLDDKGEIKSNTFYPLERKGPSVVMREPVNFPLHTGIKILDALIPIGRGQRELILGDRICQKTEMALTMILNQKEEPKRPVCIYVAIGKKEAEIARIYEILKGNGALDWTIIVAAPAHFPVPFLYLAPYAGAAVGEYFMDKGKDALVIFDNLTSHAFAWRQISLILERPPGREAYPGDIFYLHSRLLERAGKLNEKNGGGSITAIPILETQEGDITSYIPTNVISISDGQIILDTALFHRGQRPEVNIGLSVSRVGSNAQTKAMKKVAGTLKLDLAQFQELESFMEFTEELEIETKKRIERGKRLREILKQNLLYPLSFEKEVVIIFTAIKGFLDNIEIRDIKNFEEDLYLTIGTQYENIFKRIKESMSIESEVETELEKVIREIKPKYIPLGK